MSQSQASSPLDSAIAAVYEQVGETVDGILTDPAKAVEFARAVNRKLPKDCAAGESEILQRMLTLRKRGEKAGGLPRTSARRPKPR